MDFFEYADEGTVIRHYDDNTYDIILTYNGLDTLLNHESRVMYELGKNQFVIKDIKTTVTRDNVWQNTFNVVTNNF